MVDKNIYFDRRYDFIWYDMKSCYFISSDLNLRGFKNLEGLSLVRIVFNHPLIAFKSTTR